MKTSEAILRRKSRRTFIGLPEQRQFIEIKELAIKVPMAGGIDSLFLIQPDFEITKEMIPQHFKNCEYLAICVANNKMIDKYGMRGWQYLYEQAGCISQNLYLLCEERGLGTVAVGCFNEEIIARAFRKPKLRILLLQVIGRYE